MIRPFKEARELDAREAECWAMFGAEPPRWSEELVRECRPVVMSTEDFYRLCEGNRRWWPWDESTHG